MTLIPEGRRYGREGNFSDWMPDSDGIMRAVRERPEALLVIVAGLALLFRGGGRGMGRSEGRSMDSREGGGVRRRGFVSDDASESWGAAASSARDMSEGTADSIREGAEAMTRAASDMASDLADSASEYASAATRWAGDTSETLSARARSLPGELDEAVRDHPLVLAALGVAVGAALGASLPASRFESRSFGSARDQLGEAVEGFSGRFTEAAEDALDAAKQGAERRGLSGETMRGMAREAAGAFASTAMGTEDRGSGQGQNPQNPSKQGSGEPRPGSGEQGAGGSGGGQGQGGRRSS